jgi:septum formation topological specificity factor MinE
MRLFNFFTPIKSAPVARKRLHILLDADRSLNKQSDLVAILREEIFSRIGGHVTFDPSTVRVREVNGAAVCTLVIDFAMPERFQSIAMAAIGCASGRSVAAHSKQNSAALPTADSFRGPTPHSARGAIRAAEQGTSLDRKLILPSRASGLASA